MALRAAVVGFRHGHVTSIIKAIEELDYVELVGCVEESEDDLSIVERAGVELTHPTVDDLLDDVDFDIMCCGDYYARRGLLAIKALKAGRHFHTDKPLCTSLDELREIKRLTEETGLEINVHLSMRCNTTYLAAVRAVQDGRIGQFLCASVFGQHPLGYLTTRPHWYFEEGKHGGTINDLWIHGCDMMRWMTGLEYESVVSAEVWNARLPEVPFFQDGAQCLMRMDGGPRVFADVSYMPARGWQFFVSGSEAYLQVTHEGITLLPDGGEAEVIEPAPAEDLPFPSPFHDFASHLEHGTERWLPMEDCFRSTAAALTAQLAGDTGERDMPIPEI
ncbi:MAG: Gfo/Idh/MocA family oxidoreductase [Armatimonadetes bacterium]|nr:Gfo/Idh/MocA family oxidoreductase [Armatimonadota bacterium]